MPYEIKNRFTGAVIFTAAGDTLTGANLTGARLSGANLTGAYLTGADLTGARLSGANLTGANIGARTLARKLAQIRRDDGYEFTGFLTDTGDILIRAGCQTRLIADYRQHVAAEYSGTPKAVETLAILDFIEGRVKA